MTQSNPLTVFTRFGMAEQAINTIYLLAEQPDVICDGIIKRLAARVFDAPREAAVVPNPTQPEEREPSPEEAEQETEENMDVDVSDSATVTGATPKLKKQNNGEQTTNDMGDAFLLSQLVFVVGHVAIKHIVYLELVERELKRRKEVAAKGASLIRFYLSSLSDVAVRKWSQSKQFYTVKGWRGRIGSSRWQYRR
jgi:condensin complex subunit 1